MNIARHFFTSAAAHPHKAAIIDRDGRAISFGELANEVKTAAAYYRSKGIGRGDRVLVFVPMSIELYRSVLAIFHIGAVAIFLDEWVSRERLELCCRMAQCKAFIAPFKLRALAFLLSPQLRRVPVWLGKGIKKTDAATEAEAVAANETALITFTTGSTGIPKAADRTHAFLQAQFDALVDEIQPAPDDVDMPVLPIVLLLNLGSGITSVIADYNSRKPKKLNPSRIRTQITAHGVNRFISSPYLAEQLAKHSTLYPGKDSTQLRRIFTGGAPVFPDQAATMQQGYAQAQINIVYGSTEAEPISRITASELTQQGELSRGLAVGHIAKAATVIILPITNSPIEVNDAQHLQAMQLSSGEVGEIVVSGPHVLRHYIDNPEAVKQNKIFTGNTVWHRTGDAGFVNDDGQLFLCGRCNAIITDKAGHMLTPFLWEGKLRLIDGVAAGTIMQQGEKIVAVIEPLKNAMLEKIKREISEAYPFDEIRVLPQIPRDPRHFSKVDYGKLKELMMK
ncbi:MAG: AMP-binding protein [Bacteroidetes bacterium]|nr:AMP-binding protein [Bacteroidota bacterium]